MLQINCVADNYCRGVVFDVTDIDDLATAIAHILVQEYDLARRLVTEDPASTEEIGLEAAAIDDIIARRLHPNDVYHRDGFLFQLMMWLAAHLDLKDGDLVALPHSQGSAKGQDSIIVHRSKSAVVGLTVCEDKATENPRDTVRDEVWPEIEVYEKGGRWDELQSNLITTLGNGGVPTAEAVKLIRGIVWNGKRRYRVRITVEPTGRTPKLFKGFDKIVKSNKESRRGETVPLQSIRTWMTELSGKVEEALRHFVTGGNHV